MSEINSFKRCIICGFNSIEQVSYFRFPRDEVNVSIWAKFCGIDVSSLKTSHRLCSKHFHPRYLRRSVEKNRYILLKRAIPSYLYPETEKKIQYQDEKTFNPRKKKKRCYLCGTNRGEDLSYFSFPRDEETKLEWAKFCGIKVENILMSYRLCSVHFLTDDILEKRKPFGGPKRLKDKAVPVFTPKKNNILVENELKIGQTEKPSDIKVKMLKRPRCCLCGHSAENFISFFSFPEELELRSAWAAYCNLSVSQLTSSHRLCHLHFTENEVLFDNRANGGLLKLKPNAVPSVSLYYEDADLHDDHSYYNAQNDSTQKCKAILSESDLTLKVKLNDSLVKPKKQTTRRFCCLCDAAEGKAPFYSFPKDSILRSNWAKFCGIPVDAIRPSDCLCQRHFKEEDLSSASSKTGRIRLKPTALPVFFGNKCVYAPTSDLNRGQMSDLEMIFDANDNLASFSSSDNYDDADVSSNKSPERRRGHFQKPRYFRDIKLSDLRSSYHVERCFNLANSTISQQRESLKVLRAQKRRMIQKLGTLKNLVKNLHSEKHADECASDSLLSYIDTILDFKTSAPKTATGNTLNKFVS